MARVDKNHICEVRTFPKPPADVKTVMTAVLLLLGEDEHTASVSMCVCTLADMDPHTRLEWECVSVLWLRWLIHGQREYVGLYCGRDGSYMVSVSMCVCTLADMDPHTWLEWECASVLWLRWLIHGQREYVCVLWSRWLIHDPSVYVWLYCGRDGSYTTSVSMWVCTVAEMDHTWSAWVCVCVLWPRWIIHGQREHACLYCCWDEWAYVSVLLLRWVSTKYVCLCENMHQQKLDSNLWHRVRHHSIA